MSPDGVVIRPYRIEDSVSSWEAVHESLAELTQWMPWAHGALTIDESRTWIETQIQARQQGTAFEFAMTTRAGRFLGGCGLSQIDMLNRRANLGYWVRSSAAGRGVVPEAVRQLRDWAFANTDLIRLEILVASGNERSQRVADKVGAVREGLLRSRLLLHDVAHDAVMFSLTR